MIRWTLAAVFAAAVAAFVFAGTIDPKTPDAEHVQYGSKFKCVAKLSCRRVSDGVVQSASCVILSGSWVMTAAHVVEGTDSWVVLCDDASRHKLSAVIVHPDYNDKRLGTYDVAIGRTEEPFDLDFYPPLYAGRDEVGKVVSICGYGMCGTFSAGIDKEKPDCRKRGGSNIVCRASRGALFCSVTDKPNTQLEFLISPGDSGGGMFLGTGELIGINSFLMADGYSPKAMYGEESAHTRVSDIRDWAIKEMNCDTK